RAVQLLELPLGFAPERGRLDVNTTPLVRELDEPAAAVRGCRPQPDQAVAFQKADHFPHRRALDVEPFGKGVDRSTPHLVQGGKREELRDAQARRLEMGIVETGDLPARLPQGVAVALIYSERLVGKQHLRLLAVPRAPVTRRHSGAFR